MFGDSVLWGCVANVDEVLVAFGAGGFACGSFLKYLFAQFLYP